MNKKMIRIISALLVLLMLVACFASCNNNEGNVEDTKNNPGETQTPGGSETQPPEQSIEDVLGFDFEDHNKTINVLYSTHRDIGDSFYAESFDGDEVAVEVYERNLAVEDDLGVTFNFIDSKVGTFSKSPEFLKLVEAAVQANTGDYDIVAGMSSAFSRMMFSGMFHDLNSVSTMDLNHSWWMKNATEVYGIQDKVFGIVGDIAHSYYANLCVIAANTNLVKSHGIEEAHGSLYDIVYNGKWTLDKMFEIGAAYGEDNGDGTMVPGDDVFGLAARNVPSRLFADCFGIELVQRQPDGSVVLLDALDERTINSYEKLYNAFNLNGYANIYCEKSQGDIIKYFADNKLIMAQLYFTDLGHENIRNMESEYMVMPMPKYDENQDDYISPLATEAAMVMIPVCTKDEELSGMVLEYLGYLGEKNVIPVYLEQTLKLKYANDPQVMDMIQYIVDRSSYTLTAVLLWNLDAGAALRNMYAFGSLNAAKSPNVTSFYDSYRRGWKKQLTTLLEDIF